MGLKFESFCVLPIEITDFESRQAKKTSMSLRTESYSSS